MQQPRETKSRVNESLVVAAAVLASAGHMQNAIGSALRIPQPKVSRLLKIAQERGWLEPRPPELKLGEIPEALYATAQRYFSPPELSRTIQDHAPDGHRCNICVLHPERELFWLAAAGKVADILRRAQVVGVTWGHTIKCIADQLVLTRPDTSVSTPSFIPLCGEPVFVINKGDPHISSSLLAAQLNRLSSETTDAKASPSLAGVPAYISSRFSTGRSGRVLDFVREVPGYRQIFGDPIQPGLGRAEDMDTVLTSIGSVGSWEPGAARETGSFLEERVHQEEDLTEEHLGRLAFGDLGGILIPRPDLRDADRREVERLNKGWVGLTIDHLRSCASKADSGKAPGVIVVAYGAAKAEMVSEVIKLGLGSEFIVDEGLAEKLTAIIPTHSKLA